MSDSLNVYQKIVEVRKSIDALTKDTKSFGYSYVSGTQILQKIKDKMNELQLLLIPQVLNQQHEIFNYTNDKGKDKTDFIVTAEMKYVWLNAEKPDEILEIPWQTMGQQDDISKAFGSGLTYSERYFLLKFFGVPTDDDDPDAKETGNKSYTSSGKGSGGGLASEKQLNLVKSLLKNKVSPEWDWNALYNHLKQQIDTKNEIENWTKAEASKAIEILQGKQKTA